VNSPILALAPFTFGENSDWLSSIAAARSIAQTNHSVEAILAGSASTEAADAAFAAGADKVWFASHPNLEIPADPGQITEAFAQTLALPAFTGFRLALVPLGPIGDLIGASLAQRLDIAMLGFCSAITLDDSGIHAKRASHGGRAGITVTSNTASVASLRAPKIDDTAVRRGLVTRITLTGDLPAPMSLSLQDSGVQNASLEGARLIVSGGRGIGGPEGFIQLNELAASLGGALGGSLPSVDAGWVPVFRQVGQSGKFVTPDIYVAVGISGTPQHMAGIGLHTRIVAINKDAEADIFRFAELGVVADWQDILPALIEKLNQKGEASKI